MTPPIPAASRFWGAAGIHPIREETLMPDSKPPTAAQLRILVDRAERAPLSPAEAAALRAGLDAMLRELAAMRTEVARTDASHTARTHRLP